jgi:alcohol dehydrogenase
MINQKVFINEGIDKLREIIEELNSSRVLVIVGNNSFLSIKDSIFELLGSIEKKIITNTHRLNTIENIKEGIVEYADYKPDLLIAVGGGTVIDFAKAINFLSSQTESPEDIIMGRVEEIVTTKSPLVILPTTAGTGSEATQFSVVYKENLKYSLSYPDLLPDYAILDYRLVTSMPRYVAACSGFDALSQSIESYWSLAATDESKQYAIEAIGLICENLLPSVNNPCPDNLKPMVKAAYLAGCAINISKTTAPHALSYAFTSRFSVPHGHAVASLLGKTAVLSFDAADKDARRTIGEVFDLFKTKTKEEFYMKWIGLMEACGLVRSLNSYGVSSSDIDSITESVNRERLAGHPVSLTNIALKQIVAQAI